MGMAGLITLHLTHTEEIGATDAENSTLRARILARGQEVVDKVCNYAPDWDFMQQTGTVTVLTASGDGAVQLPTDFGSFGDEGGVYLSGSTQRLPYLVPRELFRLHELNTSTGTPIYYTVSGYATNTDGTSPKIVVAPKPASDTVLQLYYTAASPTLTDAASSSGLERIPAQYHKEVILKGIQLLSAIDKGDGRTSEFDQWFKEAMRGMRARRVWGREQLQTLGQYGGLAGFRSW